MVGTLSNRVRARWQSSCDLIKLGAQTLVRVSEQIAFFRMRRDLLREQLFGIAVESLPVILFSLVFVTFMLIMEFTYHVMMVLKQASLVPAFSTVLLLRELGPVVTCLLLNSRVGAGIAAEIGSMKVTEQIDALRLLAIDPVGYLLPPRWIACVFASVSLSIICVGTGLVAGGFLASNILGQSSDHYFNTMFVVARYSDLLGCIVKAAIFGAIIPIVAAHHGLRCQKGSQGVGEAATAAVVHTSMLIIVSDFLLTFLLYA